MDYKISNGSEGEVDFIEDQLKIYNYNARPLLQEKAYINFVKSSTMRRGRLSPAL